MMWTIGIVFALFPCYFAVAAPEPSFGFAESLYGLLPDGVPSVSALEGLGNDYQVSEVLDAVKQRDFAKYVGQVVGEEGDPQLRGAVFGLGDLSKGVSSFKEYSSWPRRTEGTRVSEKLPSDFNGLKAAKKLVSESNQSANSGFGAAYSYERAGEFVFPDMKN